MESDLGELFLRAARRIRRGQVAGLAPLGLTPAQGRTLRTIDKMGRPPRMTELAERLDIVPRSVTTLVDALETAGLVRRAPDPANRRSTLIMLTTEGERTLVKMREARLRAADELFAPLTAAQRQTLRDLLSTLEPDDDRS
jgi:DNA-binding MarR family transcriptional regulator